MRARGWASATTVVLLSLAVNAFGAAPTTPPPPAAPTGGASATPSGPPKSTAGDPCDKIAELQKDPNQKEAATQNAANCQQRNNLRNAIIQTAISAAAYASAAIVCATSCSTAMLSAGLAATAAFCSAASWGAVAIDVGGSLIIAISQKQYEALVGAGMGVAGQQLSGALMGGGEKATTNAAGVVCPQAWGKNVVAAFARGAQIPKYAIDYSNLGAVIAELQPTAAPPLNLNASASGGGGSGAAGAGDTAQSSPTAKGMAESSNPYKITGKAAVENAAMAANRAPFDAFEKLTGKPAGDLVDRILNGQSPIAAAAEMAGSSLPASAAQNLAKLEGAKDQIVAMMKDEVAAADKQAGNTIGFDSAGSGGSRKTASKGDGMPDLGALMAGLMPKKPGDDKGPDGTKGVNFGGAAGQKVDKEGFYPPSRSLFEIIGTRYQMMSKAFLEGGSVVRPTPVIPVNPYLKR